MSERELIRVLEGPSITLGGVSLRCKVLPSNPLGDGMFQRFVDDCEATNRTQVVFLDDAELPADLLAQVSKEVEESLSGSVVVGVDSTKSPSSRERLREVRRILEGGSNWYGRLVSPPEIVEAESEETKRVLRLVIGPCRYGIALAAEWAPELPVMGELSTKHNLNCLGVRVGYVYDRDRVKWLICQRKNPNRNATYKGAWEMSAAGYVDVKSHRDPDEPSRVSLWSTAARELSEELGISLESLPYRDKYEFLCVTQMEQHRHTDVVGWCQGEPIDVRRLSCSARVSAFDEMPLEPEAAATFVGVKQRWVPSAVVGIMLVLIANGYERSRVESEFRRVVSGLDLESR